MLRLRGGGGPSSRGFRGRIRRSGALQEPPSPGPWNPRGGAETPPRPGVCLGFVQGSRGGGPAQARSEFAPRGRYFAPGENGRPGRPHAATALDGRPARAWPAGQGPSPRPFPAARSSPLRSCARLGPQGFWGKGSPELRPCGRAKSRASLRGLNSPKRLRGPASGPPSLSPPLPPSLPLPPPWRERGPGRGRQVAGGGGPGQLSHGGRGRRSGEEGRRGGAAVPEQALLFSLKGKFCRGSRGLYAVGAGRDSRPAGSRWGRGVGMEPAGPGRRGSPAPVARVVAAPSPAAPVTPVASTMPLD